MLATVTYRLPPAIAGIRPTHIRAVLNPPATCEFLGSAEGGKLPDGTVHQLIVDDCPQLCGKLQFSVIAEPEPLVLATARRCIELQFKASLAAVSIYLETVFIYRDHRVGVRRGLMKFSTAECWHREVDEETIQSL